MAIQNESQAIAYINHKDWQESRLGLERVVTLLEKMGNPQKELSFIHVAGTNGKGSTCAMLAEILQASGYTVGLHTSPFLHVFHERMRVNGVNISEQELTQITNFVKDFAQTMEDHPTEFEMVTAVAFEYFKRRSCDIVVLEVGLGGRLDATNVIDCSEVSVITAVDFDHMAQLGNTLEKIAREKAGIIKKQCPVVVYKQDPQVLRVIQEVAKEHESPVFVTCPQDIIVESQELTGQVFHTKNLSCVHLPLLGQHQIYNVATALSVVEVLKNKGWVIENQGVVAGLAKVRWPARFERLAQDPDFILDGGHNVHGMNSVVKGLKQYYPNQKVVVLTGVMKDKEYTQMYDILAPFAQEFIAVQPHNPRRLSAQELKVFLSRYQKPVQAFEDIPTAIDVAIQKAKASQTLVLAVGSLYMCGEIRNYFGFDIDSGL